MHNVMCVCILFCSACYEVHSAINKIAQYGTIHYYSTSLVKIMHIYYIGIGSKQTHCTSSPARDKGVGDMGLYVSSNARSPKDSSANTETNEKSQREGKFQCFSLSPFEYNMEYNSGVN